jgi:hypothetical protein
MVVVRRAQSRTACLRGESHQDLAQLSGVGDPLWKRKPRGAVSEREIGAIRIDAGELPGAVRLAE